MKVYFNGLGVVTGVDTTGDSLRQGSVNVSLEAIFDGIDNSYYSAKFDFTRNDGSRISGVVMQWDAENGEAFRYSFGDAWFFAKSGQTSLTIYLYDSEGTVIAQGQVQFSIEETDYGDEPTITINQFNSLMTALASKIGMPSSSLRVDELPETGDVGVFYVVHDDDNDPTRANIYVWNRDTEAYLWVGSNELDLNKYYTKEEGGAFEENVLSDVSGFKTAINQRVTSVENELESVASGSPKGVFGTLADLRNAYPSGNSNIYVVLKDGKWYYWNGSAWTAGGQYLESGIGDDVELLKRINLVDLLSQGKYDSLIQGSYVSVFGREIANADYQEYVYNSPRFRYIKIGGYGSSPVSAIAFYSSEKRTAVNLISVVAYPIEDGDSIYEKYAEVPSTCRCVVFSTKINKDGVYAYGPAYDYLYETFISKSDGGELEEGVIYSENDELQQKVYFGNGRIGVQDTDDEAFTYYDVGHITDDGRKFYFPLSNEKDGRFITDKWSGFSDYLTKADAEEEYAKKTDLENYATKADLEDYATKADLNGYATKKDFDDLKSIVYGIHSLTYNSYEFGYLTTSVIPEEVDGRKVVGGSYAIADWVGGNSVSFNQLIPLLTSSTISGGVTFTASTDGRKLTLSGTSSGYWTYVKNFNVDVPVGHKVLVSIKVKNPNNVIMGYRLRNSTTEIDYEGNDYQQVRTTTKMVNQIQFYGNPNIDYGGVEIEDVQLFDLTLMGLDNITTVSEFKALFPLDYYPYNSGEIKSTIVSKIESWGYNLFDEEWEQGYYNPNNGAIVSNANRIRSTNFVKVTAGKSYTLEATSGTSSSGFTILYYNENKELLDGDTAHNVTNGVSFALPNYVRYIKFYTSGTWYGGTYKNDICFHITGSRTGYAPYVGKLGEINIPNAPLKLDGVNDVHNPVTFVEQEDGTYNAILKGNTAEYTFTGNETIQNFPQYGENFMGCEVGSLGFKNETAPLFNKVVFKKGTISDLPVGSCYLYGRNLYYNIGTNDEQANRDFVNGLTMYFQLATPTSEVIATGLKFDQVSFLMEKGGTIKAVYEGVPPTTSIDFMTKGE